MGANKSKQQQSQDNKKKLKIQEEWETIDHMNNFNIVKKYGSEEIGEVRKFQLDPIYDLKKQLKIYGMRGNSSEPIVQTYAAEILERLTKKDKKDKKKNFGFCASNNYLAVITERMPIRLEQLFQVTFPESLYLLRESLKGYKYLYPKSGPVHVNNRMIGLNDKKKCKVWVNQDWSQNHPSNEIKSLASTRNLRLDRQYNLISPEYRDQKEMVENIIDVIEDKCEAGKFPGQFSGLLRSNGSSFRSALQFVEGFTRDHRIFVGDSIQSSRVRVNPESMHDIKQRQRIYENQYHSMNQNQPLPANQNTPTLNNPLPYNNLSSQKYNPITFNPNQQKFQETNYNNISKQINNNYFHPQPTFTTNNIPSFNTQNNNSKPTITFGSKNI